MMLSLDAWLKPFYDCNEVIFTDASIRQQASRALRTAGIADICQLRQTFLAYTVE